MLRRRQSKGMRSIVGGRVVTSTSKDRDWRRPDFIRLAIHSRFDAPLEYVTDCH